MSKPDDKCLVEADVPKGCSYKKICHSDRVNFIYMNKVLGKDKMWIS